MRVQAICHPRAVELEGKIFEESTIDFQIRKEQTFANPSSRMQGLGTIQVFSHEVSMMRTLYVNRFSRLPDEEPRFKKGK